MRILRLTPFQVKQNRAPRPLFHWLVANSQNPVKNFEKASFLQRIKDTASLGTDFNGLLSGNEVLIHQHR